MAKATTTRTCKPKVYSINEATVVKKVTCGEYGDPAGYEETLYQTAKGEYFLYTNGGENSKYPKETITPMTKTKATTWLNNN